MKHTKGFTILELLLVISLLGLLCGFGVPAYRQMMVGTRVDVDMQRLYRAIQYARSAAIRHNAVVTLCASSDGKQCGTDWHAGYMEFVDVRADGCVDPEDKILKIFEKNKGNGILRWKGFPNKSVLQFLPMGFTNHQNGTFYYESDLGMRKLIVSKTGRVRFG